jgi:regulator of CtrA degradation
MDAVATAETRVTAKVIDALYVEAMVLADDTRAYFDQFSRDERDALGPMLRVAFSCESLKVTTRLMHVIAWLLAQRAQLGGRDAGFLQGGDVPRLAGQTETDLVSIAGLPDGAVKRIEASLDLYARVARLDEDIRSTAPTQSPARALMDQLAKAF